MILPNIHYNNPPGGAPDIVYVPEVNNPSSNENTSTGISSIDTSSDCPITQPEYKNL